MLNSVTEDPKQTPKTKKIKKKKKKCGMNFHLYQNIIGSLVSKVIPADIHQKNSQASPNSSCHIIKIWVCF